MTKLLHWLKCRDLTEKMHMLSINNRLNELYAHGSQYLIFRNSLRLYQTLKQSKTLLKDKTLYSF